MKSNVTQIKFQEVKVNPASSKLSLLLTLKRGVHTASNALIAHHFVVDDQSLVDILGSSCLGNPQM